MTAFAPEPKVPEAGIIVITETISRQIQKAVESLAGTGIGGMPLEIDYGGTNKKTLQKAVLKLEQKKVKRLIIIPLFISSPTFSISFARPLVRYT